ncbi:MAG TPA: clostripain-related cysteine peptidase [Elusimicrobiales bacterium]|nr:clostripain-related cysteine peptidase [Elusimicrobiales bacterium]
MKTIHALLALLIGFPGSIYAQDFGLNGISAASIGRGGAAVPTAGAPARASSAAPLKKWTVIALLNGKNNLSGAAEADINEMEAVGSNADINVVVEAGTVNAPEGKPPVFSVKRYYVNKDADAAKITSRAVMTLKKADMGSWQHLAEFITWAKTNYPAERYMVVVWNHGSGWKSFGKPLAQLAADKGISYDDETGNHITAIEMAAALAQAGPADVFASDACLMQELATNYEIRRHAEVIVGSEETEPNEGQDYTRFLGALAAAPSAPAEELGRMYVKAYRDFYAGTKDWTTISAVRAKAFDGLLPRVSALADALLAGDIQFAKDSRRKTLKFADPDARDLGHFARIVAQDAKDPAAKAAAAALDEYIRNEVVIAKDFTGQFQDASGLATYLPVVYLDEDRYAQMSFAMASSWDALIKKMKSTQSDDDYWDDYPED